MMRDLDRLFEESALRSGSTWVPRVDVFERADTLVVRAEVPGVDPENVDVTVEGGTLTISGSRAFEREEDLDGGFHRKELFEGSFKRTILLPEGTDAEAITAASKDGLLEVTIPKKPEVLPRKVTINVDR
jgi:HSP20 family protein